MADARKQYLKILAADPTSFSVVPKSLLTPEFALAAVKKNPFVICYLPTECITPEVAEEVVVNHGLIQFVPSHLWTRALRIAAIAVNPCAIMYIPRKSITRIEAETAMDGASDMIAWLPKRFQTFENQQYVIYEDPVFGISKIMRAHLRKDICELAVKRNPMSISNIPNRFKTEEMCFNAVQKNGRTIAYVPKRYRSNDLKMLAVKRDGIALGLIPHNEQTADICYAAYANTRHAYKFMNPKCIGLDLWLEECFHASLASLGFE